MNIFKKTLLIVISILMITGSCKNSSKQDSSLTVEDYMKLGMPDPDKMWTYNDYINALITLDNLRILDPLSYPMKNSPKSGVIFKRLINKENLTFLNDKNSSLYEKAYIIQNFADFHNKMNGLYAEKSEVKTYYNEELIDIYLFALYVNDQMLDLSVKINKSDDPADIVLQPGQYNIILSYMSLIARLLKEQQRDTIYSSEGLDRFSREISQSLIHNLSLYKQDYGEELASHLQEIADKSSSEIIKKNYLKALEAIKNK
jgi:hypothetical protein